MNAIYIAHDGEQTGPFSEEIVVSMITSGKLTGADLAWYEGLDSWKPLSDVFPQVVPPVISAMTTSTSEVGHSAKHPGFGLRCVACFLDLIAVYFALIVGAVILGFMVRAIGIRDRIIQETAWSILVGVVPWLYSASMESSAKQATLGKLACGFRVTDMNGQRISFGRATGRYFAMILSSLTLGIGYFMCAWTERKQCLHDMIAGCLMFKKSHAS